MIVGPHWVGDQLGGELLNVCGRRTTRCRFGEWLFPVLSCLQSVLKHGEYSIASVEEPHPNRRSFDTSAAAHGTHPRN